MEKYFIQNDTTGYFVQIFEKDFVGTNTEIFGKVSFEKGSVDNILDTIRGTGLKLQLEANINRTFDEFSEVEDEKKYTVQVKKGSQIVFNGFLKPDGITQSFVRDEWYVDLDFIDGLGSLKDLAFVKPNGLNFTGKMSVHDVIMNSLARTGLVMPLNSFLPIEYIGYSGSNILKDTYVSSDRFFKIDAQTTGGGTTMTCEEVLKSVLNIFSACITQQDGQWWLYRPNDLTPNVTFIDNNSNTTFVKNIYKKVGSQIDNFYPHHCSGNQTIQTKGAISAYRLNYKYGFRQGELANPNLNHDSSLNFDSWTKATYLGTVVLINDPNDTSGLIMQTKYILFNGTTIPILTSQNVSILAGSQIDIIVEMASINNVGENTFVFRVGRSDGYFLQNDGTWKSGTRVVYTRNTGIGTFSWTLKAEPVPNDCTVFVEIRNVLSVMDSNTLVEIKSVQINNNFNYDGRVGEFHTVTRLVSPSSIVKENQEVYNGDSIDDIFEGAIYKSDQTTLTTEWTRVGYVENKRILQISAEDDLRIQQKPIKEFSGDFFGEIPYLSIIEINGLNGLFMFTEYSYDTDRNITSGKLLQFYTNEVTDLQYALSYDYGNTVKPSIKG